MTYNLPEQKKIKTHFSLMYWITTFNPLYFPDYLSLCLITTLYCVFEFAFCVSISQLLTVILHCLYIQLRILWLQDAINGEIYIQWPYHCLTLRFFQCLKILLFIVAIMLQVYVQYWQWYSSMPCHTSCIAHCCNASNTIALFLLDRTCQLC